MSQFNAIVDQVANVVARIVSIALLLLIASAVAAHFGFRAALVPRIDATALAWLCGAWFLWRGGKL